MGDSKLTGWSEFRGKSAHARRSLDELTKRGEALLAEESCACITASSVLTTELSRWDESFSTFSTWVRRTLDGLKAETTARLEDFDRLLARDLAEKRHEVYGASPLLIVDGIAHVEIDLAEPRVSVNGVRVAELGVSQVVAMIEEELIRVRKVLTDPTELIGQLARAYDRELRATEKQPGAPVETITLLLQLAMLRQPGAFRSNPESKTFREYPRDLFRADLYTLLASGQLIEGSRQLHFASGADTRGAIFMLVPSLGRPAHLGRLWFEEKRD